jgi:hypothetical protein
MTDPNEIIDAYQRYTRALAQANRMNKDTLFDALAQTAITVVSVEFDGEGDEGQIGEMTAHAGDGAVPLPELPVTLHHANNSIVRLDSRQTTLREAIETLCYGYLEQQHSGWENNDGAYGEFTFDVASRRIDLEFNARFTDSTLFNHSF